MIKKIQTKIKGSVLVVTLIILGILLTTALSISLVSVQERKASIGEGQSAQSLDTADSANEIILGKIYGGDYDEKTLGKMAQDLGYNYDPATGTLSGTLGDGKTFSVQFVDSSGNPLPNDANWRQNLANIKTIGSSGSTSRAVKVKVKGKISCNDDADIMLVLDKSSSINYGEMSKLKSAALSAVDALMDGTGKIQIGQVSFETYLDLDQSLTKNEETIINAVKYKLPNAGIRSTNTGDALMLASEQFSSSSDDALKIIILISDGYPCVPVSPHNWGYFGTSPNSSHNHSGFCTLSDGGDLIAIDEAKKAGDLIKDNDIIIYSLAVSVENEIGREVLKYISSGDEYFYESENFDNLEETLKQFISCD